MLEKRASGLRPILTLARSHFVEGIIARCRGSNEMPQKVVKGIDSGGD